MCSPKTASSPVGNTPECLGIEGHHVCKVVWEASYREGGERPDREDPWGLVAVEGGVEIPVTVL